MDFQYGSSSDDKASMAQDQPRPPPYQAQPQMGYPQPGSEQFGGCTQQPYPGQHSYPTVGQTVIAVQMPLTPPESDYMGYSIFTLLCCCMPLGIAALIYSVMVREANTRGDRAEAARSRRMALILNNTALGFGIVIIISSIVYIVVIMNQLNNQLHG